MLASVLVACGGDEPGPNPPSSASVSTSPTPTESPTAEPESAEDFIRRWVDAHTAMHNSGQTADFMSLSKGCTACEQLAEQITEFYAAGGYVKTKGWTVLSINELEPFAKRRIFRVKIDSAPTTYKESSDGAVKALQGGVTLQRFELIQRDDRWTTVSLSQLAS
jgi:hypothetical protein